MPATDSTPVPRRTRPGIGDSDAASGDADAGRRDVFICHATEDKEDVAAPLADALIGLGVSVWYDDYELEVGDSLTERIDDGIARCRFGLVILSRSFFAKAWPQSELRGLEMRMIDGEVELLPIWHEISRHEVQAFSARLADKVALPTSKHGIVEIAEKIAGKVASVAADNLAPPVSVVKTAPLPLPSHPGPTGTNSLALAAGAHRHFFTGVTVSPHSDLQGRFYLDVRKNGISPGEYAGLCNDLASTGGAAGEWRALLDIQGQEFAFGDCEITPKEASQNRYYVDVRAHTDSLGYQQVVEALAAAATAGH